MTEVKPKSLKNHIFWKKAFFEGVPAVRIIENLRIKATSSPMHIINENIFIFGLAGGRRLYSYLLVGETTC